MSRYRVLSILSHYLLHCSRYTGIRTEMMADIAALVEVNGITLDIDNHRQVVNILLKGNPTYTGTDNSNQTICSTVQKFINESHSLSNNHEII